MTGKMPPPEKIYEAWSAIASGRVHLSTSPENSCGDAEVISSNGAKTYQVHWQDNIYSANDNATFWQNYPGYPVLALLMLREKLPYDASIANYFANVDWNAQNKKHGRDYVKALDEAFAQLHLDENTEEKIRSFAQKSWAALQNLDISVRRYRKPKATAHGQ